MSMNLPDTSWKANKGVAVLDSNPSSFATTDLASRPTTVIGPGQPSAIKLFLELLPVGRALDAVRARGARIP
jgi:hypothetical protein